MVRTLHAAAIAACLLTGSSALAGTVVLGSELGITTSTQLKRSLPRTAIIEALGINEFSGGAMFNVKGASHDIDGLSKVTYLFDEHDKLAAVIMTMNKERYDAVFQYLSAKYALKWTQRPFVGNQLARFRQADAAIELDAPHMSFEMEVRYIRHDLEQQFGQQSAAAARARRKAERSKF